MKSSKDVLTVKEAASAFRVSAATIRRLIAAKQLIALRVGRSVRIEYHSLRRAFSTREEARD